MSEMNSRSEMRRLSVQAPDQLIAEIERLRSENEEFRKHRGIACMTHDLVGYIACGHCLEASEKRRIELEMEVIEYEKYVGEGIATAARLRARAVLEFKGEKP